MFKFLRTLVLIVILGFIALMLYRISDQLKPSLDIDESRITVIEKLQALHNIETAKMNLTKIIEGEQELTDYLPGFEWDDTINNFLFKDITRMEIYGEVVAGFDLSEFTGTAVIQNADNSIDIILPQPSILSSRLSKDTRVYDKDLGLFSKGNKDTETQMRNRAREIIESAALSGGILEHAKENASGVFDALFGDNIVIRTISFQP